MALQLFGDFSFVGGDDTTANPYQDAQQTLNYYVEASPSKAAKEVTSLLGRGGLVQVAAAPGGGAPGFSSTMTQWPQPSSVTNLPVRGMWVLPGRNFAIVVIADIVYLATIVTPGSLTTVGALNLKNVGNLNTSFGPVSIRDNGVQGGYAVLVDGTASYLLQAGTNKIVPGPFPASNLAAFIDGWWIFNMAKTAQFFTNGQPYSPLYNASLFALKDAFSDLLMGVVESKEELWLPGETTTEIWYDAGGSFFPFQRLVGTLLQIGCKATYSISRLVSQDQEGLIWFGRSDRGENVVIRTSGFTYETVSTPAVSNQFAQYTTTSDAIGFTFQEGDHEFYMLTFPTADKTWVYDATMPPDLAWSQWPSYDPYAKAFHRHRANCYMNFGGMRIVGDYQNGALYQMTRSAHTDAGWPILARRRSPYIWDKENRERIFMSSLQIDFAPGQGNASGLGSDPHANLRISRDYGSTYGPMSRRPLGKIGKFLNRCMWRKLGWSRGAVAEIEVIDPVNRDIVGCTLRAFGS